MNDNLEQVQGKKRQGTELKSNSCKLDGKYLTALIKDNCTDSNLLLIAYFMDSYGYKKVESVTQWEGKYK